MSITSLPIMPVGNPEQSDDRLLHAYLKSNDQDAFAVLVRRYGPMVWGVCRRILRDTHDAEDAFQATFAVLVRKAPSIRRKGAIGGWLHQVARRAALRASTAAPRRANAVDAANLAAREMTADSVAIEHIAILDEEIARLPESLRLPIVLCYLQGMTNRDAAESLGCPEGTIVSRLARARGKLRERLVRRGLVLSGTAAVSTLLTQMGLAATLRPELLQAALACGSLGSASGAVTGAATGAATGGMISAKAAQLAGETLRWLNRRQLLLRVGQVAGVALAVCCGLILLAQLRPGERGDGTAASGSREDKAVAAPPISLDGVWQAEELEHVGGATPQEHGQLSRECRWVISNGTVRVKWSQAPLLAASFQTDVSQRPYEIDFTVDADSPELASERVRAAFTDGDVVLEMCSANAASPRPNAVKAGIVECESRNDARVRAGLLGYARLRRLARSFEAEDLQGRWVVVSWEAGGEEMPADPRQAAGFDDNRYTLEIPTGPDGVIKATGTFKLDPANPKQFMEMVPSQGETFQCRYEVEGDTLRLCMAAPGAPRPAGFKTQPNQLHVTFVFRRYSILPVDLNFGRPPP